MESVAPSFGLFSDFLQCLVCRAIRHGRTSFELTQIPRGLVLSFGALQSFYQFSLLKDHSASSISWIGALQSFLLVFTGIFTGPVYDLGYHKSLLFTGGFLTVFGMMMLSLCTTKSRSRRVPVSDLGAVSCTYLA